MGACESPSLIMGTVPYQIRNHQSNIIMVSNPATAPLRRDPDRFRSSYVFHPPKSQRRSNVIVPASSMGSKKNSASTIATESTIRHNIDGSYYTARPRKVRAKKMPENTSKMG